MTLSDREVAPDWDRSQSLIDRTGITCQVPLAEPNFLPASPDQNVGPAGCNKAPSSCGLHISLTKLPLAFGDKSVFGSRRKVSEN